MERGNKSILVLLYPIYWISKYTGVLPLSYTFKKCKNVVFSLDTALFKLSAFYLTLIYFRDLYYVSIATSRYFHGIAIDADYFLSTLGNILFHLYVLSIINFVLFKVKLLPKIINDIHQMYTIISKQSYNFLRNQLFIYLLLVNFIYCYFFVSFYINNKLSPTNVFINVMSTLSTINQISIELQFWSICSVITHCIYNLNLELSYFVKNSLFSRPKLNKLRVVYRRLTDICDEINQIYDKCLLSFLFVSGLYIQYDTYIFLTHLFDYFMLNKKNSNFLSEFIWIVFKMFRVFQQIWVCMQLENQVRLLKNIISYLYCFQSRFFSCNFYTIIGVQDMILLCL
jgi:hypothetical protein